MRKNVLFFLLSCLLVTLLFAWKENIPPAKASPDIYYGDLVLSGNNVTVIEGRFDINGSIIVQENATLILRNAVINFTQTENYQFRIKLQNPVNGSPRLWSENTTITASNNRWFFVELLENSTATISNSTITSYLSLHDSANVSVSNSWIRFLQVTNFAYVSVSNSIIDYALSADYSAVVSVSNCTLNRLLAVRSESVVCSIADLRIDQHVDFWDYYINTSLAVAPGGYAPTVNIINTNLHWWQFSFNGATNATIVNSEITYLHSYYYSRVWLTNSTVSHIQYHLEGQVYVSWYLDVHVVDSIDQEVPSANVTAIYPNVTVAESKLADANGWTRLTLMEKMMNATGEYPIGNYTVEATYSIYSDATTVNMTGNQQITLTLEGFVIPEFPSFLILPLFMIITLLAVIIYRRKQS
jgi:hypothetical protein